MTKMLETIGEYGARDSVRELPQDVIHFAKRAVIDWFSALYPGTCVAPARNLVDANKGQLGVGKSTVAGFGVTAFAELAAWINGSASHSVEFDDIFKDAVYHPGCPTIAAALAVAQECGASGKQFLNAVVVGYEISTRIGAAVQPSHYKYFHTTGTAGSFGGAAAAAALLAPGDASVMAHALATVGTFASGLQQAFRSDSMSKPLHAGHAASIGVAAARAAAFGVTGALDILEGPAGFGAAMSDGARWEVATDRLGDFYNITIITQKNHGCCGHTFAAIDGVLEMRRQGLASAGLSELHVATYQAALDVAGNPSPNTAAEAKFSLPYVCAHALVHGSVRLDAFEATRIADASLRALMPRITVVADRELTASFPNQRAARVSAKMNDGRHFEFFAPFRKGDPEAPLSDADINDKFDELVAPVIGNSKAKVLRDKLWQLERLQVSDLHLD